MKVIVKHPGTEPEVIEVAGIRDINKLVGNVDENGNGWDHAGSDVRNGVLPGVEEYCKENAAYNAELEENLWSNDDAYLLCGTVVFAGYDGVNTVNCGACSLTEEQIEMCRAYIERQKA